MRPKICYISLELLYTTWEMYLAVSSSHGGPIPPGLNIRHAANFNLRLSLIPFPYLRRISTAATQPIASTSPSAVYIQSYPIAPARGYSAATMHPESVHLTMLFAAAAVPDFFLKHID